MPVSPLKRELNRVTTAFVKETRVFAASTIGLTLQDDVRNFSKTYDFTSEAAIAGAVATLAIIDRLPNKIAENPDRSIVDFDSLPPSKRGAQLANSVATLEAGMKALMFGNDKGEKLSSEKLLLSAFGGDKASIAIRKPFAPDTSVNWPEIPGITQKQIEQMVWNGTMMDVIKTFRNCGMNAKLQRENAARVRQMGTVTSLVAKPNACPDSKLTIHYSGFDATSPESSNGEKIVLVLPNASGESIPIPSPIILDDALQNKWNVDGSIEITLPKWIGSGHVGFYVLPGPIGNSGCEGGSLTGAVGQLMSIVPSALVSSFVNLMHIATKIETSSVLPFTFTTPCDQTQPCWLNAGNPVIKRFEVKEGGPVHPRGYVTLEWDVVNASDVKIVAIEEPLDFSGKPGSENPHELPAITIPLNARSGSLKVMIPCTRNWIGRYELRASNAHGCSNVPITEFVRLESLWSEYCLGVGKAEIDFRSSSNLALAGFADNAQVSTGYFSHRDPATGSMYDDRVYARAFIVASNKVDNSSDRMAIVVADIWTCTQAVKTQVVKELARYTRLKGHYTVDRVMISGTHTHAVPGGYSDYQLYNFSGKGRNQQVFETIVRSITSAILMAHDALRPGLVYHGSGDVKDCGENRSSEACALNPEVSSGAVPNFDMTMSLLKFEKLLDGKGTKRPIGLVNWYAIHPTSLGYRNTLISGDSKGFAANHCEATLSKPDEPFIAGFANSSAGDISGNVIKGIGMKPLGSSTYKFNSDAQTWFKGDADRMIELGTKQSDVAQSIFKGAASQISGPIAARYAHIDMSMISIAGSNASTYSAALGVSFGAGSSEDSDAMVYLTPDASDEGLPVKIVEGVNQHMLMRGAAEVVPVIIPLILGTLTFAPAAVASALGALVSIVLAGPVAIVGTAVTIVPNVSAIVELVLNLLRNLPKDYATSYLFQLIGMLAFPDEVNKQTPIQTDGSGHWSWVVPNSIPVTPDDLVFAIGHGAKPIMMPVGRWKIQFTPLGANTADAPIDCPLVPNIVPIQMLRIGSLSIVGVPAEFTTISGRRLTQTIKDRVGDQSASVIISNYTNAYSGYVTTEEEYGAQHYEGASTLYGPHTLAAYQQEIGKLATDIISGQASTIAIGAPFEVPAKFDKLR